MHQLPLWDFTPPNADFQESRCAGNSAKEECNLLSAPKGLPLACPTSVLRSGSQGESIVPSTVV